MQPIMSELMKDQKCFLTLLLTTASPKQAAALLRTITPSQYKALREIALNLVRGNVPLTPRQKKELTRYKRDVLKLTGKKKTSLKVKAVQCLLKAVRPVLETL